MTTNTTVYVLNGLNENYEYGGLELNRIIGVFQSRETAEAHRADLLKKKESHLVAEQEVIRRYNDNEFWRSMRTSNPSKSLSEVSDMINQMRDDDYNRILGTKNLLRVQEGQRFCDDYEITEMPLL